MPAANPFRELAQIIHDLYFVAIKARREGKAHPLKDLNAITAPSQASETAARRTSAERGLPFAAVDAALREAGDAIYGLTQIAFGNETMPFEWPKDDYWVFAVERRLKELADHYEGAITQQGVDGAALAGIAEKTLNNPSVLKRKRTKGISVDQANAAVMEAIDYDPNRVKWSAREWSRHIGCSTSTIHATAMWQQCGVAREKAKQERMPRNRGGRKRQHRSLA